jgi:hypothetical protein
VRAKIHQFAVVCLAIAFGACSDRSDPARVIKAKHEYHAPHGGTIVRLGREEYHLEFVRDTAAGKLTVYVLDSNAQLAVRTRETSLELVATIGAEKRPLALQAVPDATAGETIGDASRFEAQADWLKTTGRFDAELARIKIRNLTFLRVPFHFPRGNERP